MVRTPLPSGEPSEDKNPIQIAGQDIKLTPDMSPALELQSKRNFKWIEINFYLINLFYNWIEIIIICIETHKLFWNAVWDEKNRRILNLVFSQVNSLYMPTNGVLINGTKEVKISKNNFIN